MMRRFIVFCFALLALEDWLWCMLRMVSPLILSCEKQLLPVILPQYFMHTHDLQFWKVSQHRVMLLYDGVRKGKLGIQHFVDLVSTMPAKLFGLFPRKGTIAPGSDADLIIFDPERKLTISAANQHQRVDYTPYEGMQIQGIPDSVLLRGKVIVRNG